MFGSIVQNENSEVIQSSRGLWRKFFLNWILMLETPFFSLINCVKLESCYQNDTQTCCGNSQGLNSVSKQMHICQIWKKLLKWDWYISKRMWIRNSNLAFQSLLSRTNFLSKSDFLKGERYCHNFYSICVILCLYLSKLHHKISFGR